jgi:hypothetical protein
MEDAIGVIMRQTDYTHDVALQKLQQHNNDITLVIREYMGVIKNDKPAPRLSANQQVFKEIRTMMDDASAKYENSKKA